tara:strand:- start:1299 stop:1775 length:477 start_codon:yes stop_codon:yes gene_type:complete
MQATTTTPLFAAELTPHRALGAGRSWLVAALVLLIVAAPGLLLLSLDALAVAMLMGLTAICLAGGLYVSLRKGKRRELVTVWPEQIEWQVTDSAGATMLRRFDPVTTRLMLTRDAYEQTVAILLRDAAGTAELGSFLSPEDKSSFAKALGTALRRARS